MKTKALMVFGIFLSLSGLSQKYPNSKTVDSSDTWHGVTIKDPYRWLENLQSDETKNWYKAENNFSSEIMDKLPMTKELYSDLLSLDSIEPDKIGKVRQVGNTLFYFNIKVGDAKARLYKRNGDMGKEILVADNSLWGNNYTINDFEIDPYQQYLAITAAEGGKEINVVKFYNIAQGKFLPDSLPGVMAGFSPGSGNVYYLQQSTWDVHEMVQDKERVFKIHHLGTDTTMDKVHLSFQKNPELYDLENSRQLSPAWLNIDCDYEAVFSYDVSPYVEMYYRKINSGAAWKKIISTADEVATVNASNNKLFLVSKKNARNGKLLVIDMAVANLAKATLIAAEKSIPIEATGSFSQSKNYLIIPYSKNGVLLSHFTIDMRTNKFSKIPFQETTNLMYITPFNKGNDNVHIARTGWVNNMSYTYSNIGNPFSKEKIFAFRSRTHYPFTDEIKVDEIEIPGHDGVMIPVSLMFKKTLTLNSANVAYITSYGAYGTSSNAQFNPLYLLMAHKGIVIAVPHVRGGGEKGESWHQSGYKQSKPNTWKDLNSTAEWLINKGYTSPKHLACEGGSAGGILIGRAVTERPDLWACAVPQVGCLSMVRMEQAPNGPVNTAEFGTVKNINEFFSLLEMDATLHVEQGVKYPAMLITTGWNDPRVISWQPAKFAAAMQKATAYNADEKPILLQVDYNGGHGDSEDKFAAMKKAAGEWAFILKYCGYYN
ncbi:MAG: prolyl oligopeptidase family serine peptidase [Chitinophagaceae bacterium]